MARKTSTYTVTEDNRDKGKVFLITEMPPMQAEKWAMRAGLALAHAGSDIGTLLQDIGMVAFAMMSPSLKDDAAVQDQAGRTAARAAIYALSGLNFAEAEPLLDELLGCVSVVNDGGQLVAPRPLSQYITAVEEPTTLFNLRKETIILHVGFLRGGANSTSGSQVPPSQQAFNSPSMSTSPAPSQPSFRPAPRRSRK